MTKTKSVETFYNARLCRVFLPLVSLIISLGLFVGCSSQGSNSNLSTVVHNHNRDAAIAASLIKKKERRHASSAWLLNTNTRISLAPTGAQKKLSADYLKLTHNSMNEILYSEFVRYFPLTDAIKSNVQQVLLEAKKKAFKGESELLVVPTLLMFQNNIQSNRETDKIVLQLDIYESYSSAHIEKVTLESSGNFKSFQTQTPASLLAPAIRQYLETITAERVLSAR